MRGSAVESRSRSRVGYHPCRFNCRQMKSRHSGNFSGGVKGIIFRDPRKSPTAPRCHFLSRMIADNSPSVHGLPLPSRMGNQKVTSLGALFVHFTAYWRTLGSHRETIRSPINPLNVRDLNGGGGGIRTHGTFRLSSFQDWRNRPLYHPSVGMIRVETRRDMRRESGGFKPNHLPA
jgi:hypothetical protein